MIANSSDPERY